MYRKAMDRVLVAICMLGIAACGGGSGGGSSGSSSGSGQGDTTSFTLSRTVVDVSANYDEPTPTASVRITAVNVPASGLYVRTSLSGNAVTRINLVQVSTTEMDVAMSFAEPVSLPAGKRTSLIVAEVCYDEQCQRQVRNSPAYVTVNYTITRNVVGEAGRDPLPYLSRTPLSHDVIDAEYSKSLEAIVMVASSPSNALYLYQTATGTELRVDLTRAPTAVSVSPDGRYAAVGHDARITHVDLESLASGAPVVKLLDVSTSVFDIVLDGRGFAHAFPLEDQWEEVHSVNVETNTETQSLGFLYEKTHGRLHPSGDYLYSADTMLSPSDIGKFDVRSGTATWMYDSPYHGDYDMCGNVWFSEGGTTIYTPCGNTFRSSTTRTQDMVYGGRLRLSFGTQFQYRITSLSQSDVTGEVLLTEEDWYTCATNPAGRCYSHVSIFPADALEPSAVYSLPPVEIAGAGYHQRGLFVFQSSNDSHRYLVSYLHDTPAGVQNHYITVIR